jgi:hypothetical protein
MLIHSVSCRAVALLTVLVCASTSYTLQLQALNAAAADDDDVAYTVGCSAQSVKCLDVDSYRNVNV